jgi:hypothetical protein
MSKSRLSFTQIDVEPDPALGSQETVDVSGTKVEQLIQDKTQRKWYSYVWDTFGKS